MIMLKLKPDILDKFHADALRVDIVPAEGSDAGGLDD
jgi:hypothetical protein